MKLEEAKNERPVFKLNLHEIKKSEGLNQKKKKSPTQNTEMLYNAQSKITKSFKS